MTTHTIRNHRLHPSRRWPHLFACLLLGLPAACLGGDADDLGLDDADVAAFEVAAAEPTAVYRPPSSIVSNCSTDVSAALQSWLASVPDDSRIEFSTNACYRTERYIQLTNRRNLVIDGRGSTFRRTQLSPPELRYPRANPHWWFQRSVNITVRNMTIQGTNTRSDIPSDPNYGSYLIDYEFEAGFRVEPSNGFVADNVVADSVWGDGIQLQGGSNATIRNSTIHRNGRQGIGVINISNVLIDNVTIRNSRRGGIDLENDRAAEVIRNVEIRNSRISSWLLGIPAGGPGAVNDVYIHHNDFMRSGVPVVHNIRLNAEGRVRRSNWRFEYNTVGNSLNSNLPALRIDSTDNVSILGNSLTVSPNQSRQAVMFTKSGGNLVVRNNSFINASAAYHTDGATGAVSACGNRLAAGGAYSEPVTCPTARLAAPRPGATISGTQVALSADAQETASIDKVEFYSGFVKIGESTRPTLSGWIAIWNTIGAHNGQHHLRARAIDRYGNSTFSEPVTVVVANR